MSYTITKDYIKTGTKRRPGKKLTGVKFIVAHDTGNDNSTARNNVNYYKNSANDMSASAHVFVDANDIIECIPLNEKAWHVVYNVKTDNQKFGYDSNDAAIGVELCYSTKGKFDTKKAYQKYVWYLARLCKTYKLDPRTKIIGHQHLDPSRKTDPTNALKTIGKTYDNLIEDVYKEYLVQTGKKPSTQTSTTSKPSSSTHTVVKGDTFWSIAQKYKVNVASIQAANPSVDPSKLKIGQKLTIPASITVNTSTNSTSSSANTSSTKKLSDSLPNVTLKKGAKGDNVLKLQQALCAVYFYPDKSAKDNGCDGVYGKNTEYAVKRFQMVHLASNVDGVYGTQTRKKLAEVLKKEGK